ncbi:MAG: SH3 domain-containing protein [Pseudomonadota bacterium]
MVRGSALVLALVFSLTMAVASAAPRLKQTLWTIRTFEAPRTIVLRAGPSLEEMEVRELRAGAVLRDHGCVDVGPEDTWCRVALYTNAQVRGWVPRWALRAATKQDLEPPRPTNRPAPTPPAPDRALLTYDAIGAVPCSSPRDDVGERCAARLVRDARGATLLLASPAETNQHAMHVLRYEDGEFRARDGTFTWALAEGDGRWRVSIGNREHYLIDGTWLRGR